RVTLSCGLEFTSRTMPVCTYVRKPGNEASNLYGPMGRFGRTYDPVSFVTAVRAMPVSVCVAVISTPGRTAPLWSFTVPVIWAVPCAHTVAQPSDRLMKMLTKPEAKRFIDFLPLKAIKF